MFFKINKTAFPPIEKPMMVWDGECGFCKYWIINWKSKTGNNIEYKTYQEVASQYPDIPLKEFRKASRLIEPDGRVFSGPDSAFRSFTYFKPKVLIWHRWYSEYKWFTSLCDNAYNYIAKHRTFMFKLTNIFFGKNPQSLKPYWLFIILFIGVSIYSMIKFL